MKVTDKEYPVKPELKDSELGFSIEAIRMLISIHCVKLGYEPPTHLDECYLNGRLEGITVDAKERD